MKLSAAIGADLSQLRRDFQAAEGLAQQTANRIDAIFARSQGLRFNLPSLGGLGAQTTKFSTALKGLGAAASQVGSSLLPLSVGITGIAAAAAKSALEIDKQVNALKAFTGSAQAAEARFKALFDLAQRTPGLTTNLGLSLDAQLRAAGATEQAINRLLPTIGRLNAISPLGDPQKFGRNLVQLITQNFERIDLKELVGQSPIAGELIKQVFSVNSAIDGKAIRESARKLGIDTIDEFATALAGAAANNPALSNATESIQGQIEKLQDRLGVALRPLGLKILQAVVPALERLVPVIERTLDKFAKLPPSTQDAILKMGLFAAAAGPVSSVLGNVLNTAGALANGFGILSRASGVAAGASGIAGVGTAAAGLGSALIPAGVAVAGLAAAWITNFGDIQGATSEAIDKIDAEFKRIKPIREKTKSQLDDTKDAFQEFSDQSTPIMKSFWSGFADLAGVAMKASLRQARLFLGDLEILFKGASFVSRAASAVFGSDPKLPTNPLVAPSVPRVPGSPLPPLAPKRSTVLADERSGKGTGTGTSSSTGKGKGSKPLTELQQEQRELARLVSDIEVFKKLSSEEFKLKVLIDQKQELRTQLNQILDLRQELKEPVAVKFPDTTAAAQSELNRLNALKEIRDGLAKQDIGSLLQVKATQDAAAMSKALESFKQVQDELRNVGASEIERAGFEIGDKFADAMAAAITAGRPDIIEAINKIIADAKGKARTDQERRTREGETNKSFNDLETARTAIQNQQNAGLISELEARRRLIQVEQEHRNVILGNLLAERALAEGRGDTLRVTELNVEIERQNGLGRQEIGEQFEGAKAALGQGINDVIASLTRGGEGLKSALLNTLNNVLSSISSALLEKAFGEGGIGGFLVESIGGFLGFADGGRPPLGQASIVGERGPELFVPDTAGTIFNQQQIAAMAGGGGGTTISAPININITSRNGRVPEETQYQIARRAQQAVEAVRQRG